MLKDNILSLIKNIPAIKHYDKRMLFTAIIPFVYRIIHIFIG